MHDKQAQRTVLIVEPHLEGLAGHSIRYVRHLTDAFVCSGARVEVLASRRLPRNAAVGASVRRVLERPVWLEWEQPFGWSSDLRARMSRLRFRARLVRSTIWRAIDDGLERPPGWRLVSTRIRRVLGRLARAGRRLLKLTLFALGAILLGPLYLTIAALTALFGRSTACSTLSPFALKCLRAIRRAEKDGPVSIVVPTATVGILTELLALPVVHDGPLPPLHLLFHDAPDVWASWYRPSTVEGAAARLRASGWRPNVHFYATNGATAKLLRKAFAPHQSVQVVEGVLTPADLDAIQASKTCRPGEVSTHDAALLSWLDKCRERRLRIALVPEAPYLDGGARVLPDLVAALGSPEGRGFALLVQQSPELKEVAPQFRAASAHQRVHVVEASLADDVRRHVMGSADVILMPYSREEYAASATDILTESALNAQPILADAGVCERLGDPPPCRQIATWRDWPRASAPLLEEKGADRAALIKHAVELDRRVRHSPAWLTLVREALAPCAPLYAKAPVILVRPFWPKSGSARLQDDQLAYFASEQRPVLELVADPVTPVKYRSWLRKAVLDDRATSPSGVVCVTMTRSGLLRRMAFLVRRGFSLLRSTYTGQVAEVSRLCPIPPLAVRLARRRQAAFLLVHHYVRLPFVAPLAKFLPVWLETQDVQAALHVQQGHVNMLTGAEDQFSAMLRDEMRYVKTADTVVAISESELPTFREHIGAEKVFFCQPPITVREPPKNAEVVLPRDILLVASDNPGNLASFMWFRDKIWPKIQATGLKCTVVGNLKQRVQWDGIDPRGIELVGPVEHLAPWYASARVVALPTVEGTGVGIKTIEAMAAGVAIVATTLAYRGLPADWRIPAPPVDDADAFAGELVRLCRDRPAREGLREDARKAYAALDLENRYRHQMQIIEAHVLAAGKARFGKPTAASAPFPDQPRDAARLPDEARPASMAEASAQAPTLRSRGADVLQ